MWRVVKAHAAGSLYRSCLRSWRPLRPMSPPQKVLSLRQGSSSIFGNPCARFGWLCGFSRRTGCWQRSRSIWLHSYRSKTPEMAPKVEHG